MRRNDDQKQNGNKPPRFLRAAARSDAHEKLAAGGDCAGLTEMAHAIIRGNNGRRHEVDFGDSPIRVEVHASEETVEIFVEADVETRPEERRRFAIINMPRHLFSERPQFQAAYKSEFLILIICIS
jgi:hypothetical protein